MAPAPAAAQPPPPASDDEDDDENSTADRERRDAAQLQRLQMVLAMRRHELIIELLDMAHAQEAALQQHQTEEDEIAIAIARSLGQAAPAGGAGGGGGERLGAGMQPSTALIEEVLPAMAFAEAAGFLLANEEGGGHECSICLAEMASGDRVRVLPCVHCYHAKCIDHWFSRVQSCPTCKAPVVLG